MDDFKRLDVEAQMAFDKLVSSDLYNAPAHCNSGMSRVQGAYCNPSVQNAHPKSIDFANDQMIIPNLQAPAENHASLNNKRKLATCNLVPSITENDTDGIHMARTTTRDERLKFHKKLRNYLNKVDTFLKETSIPSNGASASTQVNNNSSVLPGPCHNSNNKRKSSTCHLVPRNAGNTANYSVNQESSYQAESNRVLDKKDTDVKEQIQVIVKFRSPQKQPTAYSKRVHACKIQSSENSSKPKSMPEETTLQDKRPLEIQKDTEIVVINDNVERSIIASDEETNFGSLLNYLTIQQVKDHVSSLSNKITSDHSSGSNIGGRCCTLCGLGEREFQLSSCSYCAKFIKDGAKYYRQDKYNIFCKGCSKNIDPKLLSTYNVEHEMWIQCETCCCWNHQICALYNNLKNKGKRAIHRCPSCYIKEIGSKELRNIGKARHFEAKDLPRTELSDFIELRLSRKLEEDRKRRQVKSGNNNNEVPVAKDLVFREVSSLNKIVKVDESVHKVLLDDASPKEFTCKSKVFLLFQKIKGVDVCIFALYAEEYGSDCPPPNKGCVYLSYIDSVHYLRPCIQDADGESYRSFVYHQILLGYMESCKKRNFNALHLWAYPPDKKTIDFIFYSRPKEQKIPDKKHLLDWYQCLIDKAMEEKIVVGKTNLFDKYFDPKERKMRMFISSKIRDVIKKLPYFDGDYWPKLAQRIIYDLRHDVRNKSFIGEKWMCDETIKKIYDIIHHKGAKAPLMILQLQNCDATEETSNKEDMHDMMENNKVGLSEDVNISNPIIDTRTNLLNHCHEYHYQFDSLRNAKHSTMMLLYHLVKKQLREPD